MNYPTTMRVLALDLATTTGHALLSAGIVSSGSQDFHSRIKKGIAPAPGEQFARFDNWLRERICDDKPHAIAYEEVFRWMSSSAAHVFCGFRAIMLNQALRAGVRVHPYTPSAIKKFWTGNGAAKKDLMVAQTIARFPDLDLADDNEADAIAILHFHLSAIK